MENPHWDAEMMLRHYIHDYMVQKNLHVSAKTFKEEANLQISPVAISDSPWGLLLEWWSIFSDMYFTRQSNLGTEQAFVASPSSSSKQYQCLQVMEHTSVQPSAFQSGSSAMPLDLDERLIRQLKDTKKNWQFATQTNYRTELTHDARLQNHLQMIFRHQQSIGSNPLVLCPTSTRRMPTPGFSHTDLNQHYDWPFSGVSSSFMNLEHDAFDPLFISNKLQNLQQVTGNYHVNDLPLLGSLSIELSSTGGQKVDAGCSNYIGSPTQKDSESVVVAKPVNGKAIDCLAEKAQFIDQQSDQGEEKRKQPSNSGTEETFASRDSSIPSKINCHSFDSPSSDASATSISTESKGKNQLANTLKPTTDGLNANEGSREDNTESLPSGEDFHDKNNEDKHSGVQEQNTSTGNK